MLEPMFKLLAVILISCLALNGCGYLSKDGRQQIAYARYVKKHSGKNARNRVKFKAPRMPALLPPSPSKVTAEVSESPQSISTGGSLTSE